MNYIFLKCIIHQSIT